MAIQQCTQLAAASYKGTATTGVGCFLQLLDTCGSIAKLAQGMGNGRNWAGRERDRGVSEQGGRGSQNGGYGLQ